MALYQRLLEIPFFSQFSPEEAKLFANLMEEVEFEDKEMIVSEKTPTSDLYFIVSGKVNIFKMMFGSANFLSILEKNDIFGEVGFVDEKARSASVGAFGKVCLLKFTHEHFHVVCDQNPQVGIKFCMLLLKELSRKFRAVNEGIDIKSPEQTIYELISTGQTVKISTSEAEYICTITYADKSPTNPFLKIDVKGSPILLPFNQIKSLTLPNKFGMFS